MFGIRILIVALTLTFLFGALMTKGIGLLEAVVITCPLVYMILDMKEELRSLRSMETRVFLIALKSSRWMVK
jgi:hypothetical protein